MATTATNLLLALLTCLFAAGPFAAGESLPAGDGLLLDLLWLAAATLAALAVAKGVPLGEPVRWNHADFALLLFLGLAFVAGIASAFVPPVRPSLTFAAHVAGLAAAYLLARTLISTPARRQAAALAMTALAASLASYGIHQALVELPRLRTMFASAADPAAMLRSQGLDFVPGTPSWTLFQNRLQSPEPFASFALANSLAGFLAPWLAVLLWLAGRTAFERLSGPPVDRPRRSSGLPILLATAAVVFVCLALTRSRTAWLALVAGLVGQATLLGFARCASRSDEKLLENTPSKRLLVGLVCGTLLLGVAAAWAGGLDRGVLSEAGRSLGYRLQYWRGAAGVAAERPLLGCGPGKFGDWYTRYKAPDASEEVQDPHQMFLETAAVAGVPALLALLAVVACGIYYASRRSSKRSQNVVHETAPYSNESKDVDPSVAAVWIGGASAGLAGGLIRFAEWSPLSAEGFWWCLFAPPVFCLLLARVSVRPQVLAEAAAAGWLTWLVDLQAAGGIYFPGVAASGWLLYSFLAAGPAPQADATQAEASPSPAPAGPLPPPSMGRQMLVLAASACFAGAYLVCYQPVQAARSAQGKLQAAEGPLAWEEVVEADPQDAEIARSAASAALVAHLSRPSDPDRRSRYEHARDRFRERRGENDSAFYQLAEWEWARFQALHEPPLAAAAADFGRKAISWYPNSARRWAVAARAEAAAGRPSASAAASRALELHHATPHLDQKLAPALVAELARLASPAASR